MSSVVQREQVAGWFGEDARLHVRFWPLGDVCPRRIGLLDHTVT